MQRRKLISMLGLVMMVAALSGCQGQADGPATPGSGWREVVAQQAAQPRSVTTTGNAEVRVVPDEVVLTLGVETWDKDMATAKGKNDAIVQKVLGVAKESGLEASQIQTDYISIEPRYEDSYTNRRFVGYFVRKTIALTLREMTQFEGLLSGVLDAGANYLYGIDFRTTELRKHRDEARAMAIKAAQEKAQALAKELGHEVGEPISIHEEQENWWAGYSSWWGGRGNAMMQNVSQNVGGGTTSEGPMAPGVISVSAQVTVEFDLR